VSGVRSDHTEPRKAEVSHGARDCADIERIAGRNENDVNAVALGLGEQELIVERCASLKLE
jgi:hypothetical protein